MTNLYDILGKDVVEKAVKIFYGKVINDERVSRFFAYIDMNRQISKQKMFLNMLFGGPMHYTGRDLASAHAGLVTMGLTEKHFDIVVNHLVETIRELEIKNISEADLAKMLARIQSFKADILSGVRKPVKPSNVVIRSLQEYIEVITQFSHSALFRGQADADWSLVPSLARIVGNGSKINLEQLGGWSDLEEELINRFQRHGIPFMQQVPHNFVEWLVVAQHYGLPTRLLDWSQSPLVSLYFALRNDSGQDSAVWVLDPITVRSASIDIENLESIQVYFPPNVDAKTASQRGCFTIQPLPDFADPFVPLDADKKILETGVKNLGKIVIPAAGGAKQEILYNLANQGIDEASVYPDLFGLSRQIKNDLLNGILRL